MGLNIPAADVLLSLGNMGINSALEICSSAGTVKRCHPAGNSWFEEILQVKNKQEYRNFFLNSELD